MGNETLTAAQQAAVSNRGGPLLVSAAAGSGKTKVLVDRLMSYLLAPDDPANIDDFLIITYTKAAAAELRGKIASKLTQLLAQQPGNRHLRGQLQRLYLAKISTVHSFCSEILREFAFSLELPADVRVADEVESAELRQIAMEQVLEAAYSRMDDDPNLQAFVDSQGFGRDDRAVPAIIEAVYTSAQCHVQPKKWLADCLAQSSVAGLTDAGQTIWGSFLIDRLHAYLDGQLTAMRDLLAAVQQSGDLAEKYAPTLEENLCQLETLRSCSTWEACREAKIVSLGRLKSVRQPDDPELVQRVKAVRKALTAGLKRFQLPFEAASAQLLQDMEQTAAADKGLCRLVSDFAAAYDKEKQRRRVLDFGDLEHRTLELLLGRQLTGITWAAKELGSRFREVMVDEYQDTNEVQDRIFSALTAQRGNCFMVGDVKQSIYRFRLADPGIFLEKYRTYLPHEQATPGQGRKILLSENFRSGEEILAAANHVFSTAMCPQVGGLYYGEAEALRAGIPHISLPQSAVELNCIQLVEGAAKYEVEAQFVASRIRTLLDTHTPVRCADGLRPAVPGDIVILLRSPGTSAKYYRAALEAQGIPAATDSGGSILDTSEISIIRSLLQVIDNPRQDIPLQSVLLSPLFGFTADRLGALRGQHREGCLLDGLQAAADHGDAPAADFLSLIEKLRQVGREETLTRLLEEIYGRTHAEAVFSAMPGEQQRCDNLRFFYETAAAYEQGGRKDLSEFLEHLCRMEQRGLRQEDSAGKPDAVSILSIHKSKGLEYPIVFLSNLSGEFNREDLKVNVLVDPMLGIGSSVLDQETRSRYPSLAKCAISQRIHDENVSEELRVLYVAMTRAKDMLVMTYADKYLLGLLEDLAQRLTPHNAYCISQEAGCLGDWVLMAAMLRSEAAELFQQAGRPAETVSDGHPWHITYSVIGTASTGTGTSCAEAAPSAKQPNSKFLQSSLTFSYPYKDSVQAPAKLTATQIKGRILDQEAADGTAQTAPISHRFRTVPDFIQASPLQGRQIGTATHLAMQFIHYAACADPDGVERELSRLLQEQFLTRQQYESVNRQWIADFFSTELGRKLQESKNLLREFKFSILEDGSMLSPSLQGEELLLQGVVDCCILEDDGLTILDFKTDRVSPGQEHIATQRYAPQVQIYGSALSRIWKRPIKKLLLYFFQTGCFADVSPRTGEI